MARIVFGSYMVRYPLGGVLSSSLQWLVGFQRLGHEVYLVEKSGWPNSCYDPSRGVMSDDCTYGMEMLGRLLARFGLEDRWCFVDAGGRYHGLPRERVKAIFTSADLFVDRGTHGTWLEEAAEAGLRVLIDGEPGSTQMKMQSRLAAGEKLPHYDAYYTVGRNIGTEKSMVPTAGKQWRPLFHPVDVGLFLPQPIDEHAPFTTVMNWKAHEPIEFNSVTYGQKDAEFGKFVHLPRLTATPMELAVSGKNAPTEQLMNTGWRVRNAHAVTTTCDSYWEYIRTSRGEFSSCKNIFVATNSGWFSDRSAAYLASGRPVVLQDTGFGSHLPLGRGLFAVRTVDEAATAIEEINGDYERHSRWAREIAMEYLDTPKVLRSFLDELGVYSSVQFN